jgi:hypothetical protein
VVAVAVGDQEAVITVAVVAVAVCWQVQQHFRLTQLLLLAQVALVAFKGLTVQMEVIRQLVV